MNRNSCINHVRLGVLSIISCCLLIPTASAQTQLTFEKDIRPILKTWCIDCHGGTETVSGMLDLRLRRTIQSGGEQGPAMVVGRSAESLLIHRMKSGEMPPGEKKIPADQIRLIEQWIDAGAVTLRDEPESLPTGFAITPEERSHWFYQPLTPPSVPQFPEDIAASARIRTPIDAFLYARLQQQSLAFNPDADRHVLIRRATYDLTGLPPSAEEVDQFLADTSEHAWEHLLDRLLASPAYGERWARHWLDAVGYSDSDGDGSADTIRPFSWRYRDYVIRSFNQDKPFSQFVVEQLAGDELIPQPWNNLTLEQIDVLAATGFLRTAPDPTATGNTPANAEQVVTDTMRIVTSSLLASSVGCAQCHDHRYDPISQQDYYQLRAIFEPVLDPAQWRPPTQRNQSLFTDADRKRAAEVDAEVSTLQAAVSEKQQAAVRMIFLKELEKFPAEERETLRAAFETPEAQRTEAQKTLVANNPRLIISPGVIYQYDKALDDEIKALSAKVDAKRSERPIEQYVSIAHEVSGRVPPTRLLHRGDPRQPKGDELPPADLTIAAPDGERFLVPPGLENRPSAGRRLAWARHLTNGTHPLFNRAQVNRIWLHHFGRGLVETPGEFGRLGQLPSHPELLNWLAVEFAQRGWSLKAMHKLIMMSTAYRQSSTVQPADASNQLYSRYPLRRMEAEAVRDSLLSLAGRLDRTQFGPPIAVTEDTTGQVITPDDQPRRSIYLQSRRSKPVAFLTTFDAPAGELTCDRRQSMTSAQQALTLMNSEFIRGQAGAVARRVIAESSAAPAPHPDWMTSDVLASLDRPESAWFFGYGSADDTSGATTLTKFPHFTGTTWQGSAALPDAVSGWALIHAQGGHAGNDPAHATIRRWTAPHSGRLTVTGTLGHASPNGDGVRGRIITSRSGKAGEWTVANQTAETAVAALDVTAGESVDFVVDCRESVSSDSFNWTVRLTLTDAMTVTTWDSAADFTGPQTVSLPQRVIKAWQICYLRSPDRQELEAACRYLQAQMISGQETRLNEEAALTNLCQQLLSSNEFLYVD